jgi:hypothetical protein
MMTRMTGIALLALLVSTAGCFNYNVGLPSEDVAADEIDDFVAEDVSAEVTDAEDPGDPADEDVAGDVPVELEPDVTDVVGEIECDEDYECSNDVFCDGTERCVDGTCQSGTPPSCDDGIACTHDECDTTADVCVRTLPDVDRDGYLDADCTDSHGTSGDDCDDSRDDVYPGAAVACDGVDHDCSGEPDRDEDADGYYSEALCSGGDDCDDTRSDVHPGATLVCDGVDHDCSGEPDEDEDADGHLSEALCSGGDDCDDTRSDVYTGAVEVCSDGVDQDCDTVTDESHARYLDVRITSTIHDQKDPALAWSGSEYGVGWEDNRDGNAEIYFARIDAGGSVLGSEVRITNDTNTSTMPSIAWTTSEFCLSWVDDRDGNAEIYLARVDASGSKVGSDVRVTSDSGVSTAPDIAYTGSELVVGWQEDRDGNDEIYLVRLQHDGTKIGSDVRVTSDTGASRNPDLVWTGTELVLGWQDDRDGNAEIYLARNQPDGTKVGSDVRVTSATGASEKPSLAFTSTEIGAAWQDSRDGNVEIYFARIATDGSKVGSDVRVSNDIFPSINASIAWSGSTFGLAWQDFRHMNMEIYFVLVSPTGTLGSEIRLTQDTYPSETPSLVWSPSGFSFAWMDAELYNEDVYFNAVEFCP